MTLRQQTAYRNPCARGKVPADILWAREFSAGRVMSTVLMVSLRGRPRWHVAVSLLDEKLMIVHSDKVSAGDRGILIRTAQKLLLGVGQMPEVITQYPLALHYSRALTEKELAGLPQNDKRSSP